ncbi:MAG: carbohydrate ABC transporter permease [Eubacteriales bacterium]|nr:carbohydrate ABC transporter permease [Eubacteriales bacterium]
MFRKKQGIREGSPLADAFIYIAAGLICLLTVYPMYYVLIRSVSSPEHALAGDMFLLPKGFDLTSYRIIFADATMWRAYGNTLLYVVCTTLLMLLFCTLCAYPLCIPTLRGKKILIPYLLIPMYFSGGLIPTFLVMNRLGLYNNIWAVILPGSLSIWNIILVRTYFSSIPETLRESAEIDGASHFTIMTRIYLPLAKPILAVVTIYTIVITWNSWFNALVYLPDTQLQPLQLYLRRVLVENTVDLTKLPMNEVAEAVRRALSGIQMKYAMIIFTTLPVLFAYPFFQKHFIKGMMVGSLKG